MSESKKLEGRIALVTGATRGIGRAVALRYAAEGAQTVLAARTVGGLEEVDDEIRAAGGLKPLLVPLDLREFDNIDLLGRGLYGRYGRLDVLVGNAGLLGTLSPVGHIPPDTWQHVYDLNVTANYRLIRSLDPLLRQSEAGRAIFVTSGAAQKAMAYWAVYASTKAALDMLVKCYAAEITKTEVKANLLSPGPIRTGLREQAFPGEDPMTLRAPEEIADAFVELASPECSKNGEIVSLA